MSPTMKPKAGFRQLVLSLIVAAFLPLPAHAMDTDIFTSTASNLAPNVLIILDNTASWDNGKQHFPNANGSGDMFQGQAEAEAIKAVISSLAGSVNVGLMEFVTGSGSGNNGGFIRYAISPMGSAQSTGPANQAVFSTSLTHIFDNARDTDEKTSSSNQTYGDLMRDAYNYFGGLTPHAASSKVVAAYSKSPYYQIADSNGYVANYTQFKSPLNEDTVCTHNYIIFIGNPQPHGPNVDDQGNTDALNAAAGSTVSQLKLKQFSQTTTPISTDLGNSILCYAAQPSGTPTDYTSLCQPDTPLGTYDSCAYDTTPGSTPATCTSGQRYQVIATSTATTTSTSTATTTTTAPSNSCYATSGSWTSGSGDFGGLTCPSGSSTTVGGTTTAISHSCSYSVSSTAASSCTGTNIVSTGTSACSTSPSAVSSSDHGGLTCPSGYTCSYSTGTTGTACSGTTPAATSAPSTNVYASAAAVNTSTDKGGQTCPSGSTCTYTVGTAVGTATTTTSAGTSDSNSCYASLASWSSATDKGSWSCPANSTCGYSGVLYSGANDGSLHCGTSARQVKITQTVTPWLHYTITQTPTLIPTYTYQITQTAVPPGTAHYTITQTDIATTTTTTTGVTTTTPLGYANGCFANVAACTTSDYTCPSGATCTCSSTSGTTGGACPTGKYAYKALGFRETIVTAPTNASPVLDTRPWNSDEWARMLYQKGVPIAKADGSGSTNASVSTFTIDVYHDKPDPEQSSLLESMATHGGGRYFTATDEAAIINALKSAFSEIQATNSAFASAALPISATNRAQNDNQVYIGMFRPDQQKFPRWFGNLKRYQIGKVSGDISLVDYNGKLANSATTGFIAPCAQSFWTVDSGNYWANVSGSTVDPRVFFTTAKTGLSGKEWVTQSDDLLFAKGGCLTAVGAEYSDLPDGPVVEKGGVAEMIRRAASRNVTTQSGTASTPVAFNTSNVTASADSTINTNIVNFILGKDVTGEINAIASDSYRPSVHGDVVHSRPLPVDYGSGAVRVYYGSNDGTFRSVNGATGAEQWAFVAPESFSGLQRLLDNSPKVQTPTPTPPNADGSAGTPADGTAKTFFFDGSTGLYQNRDNTKVWIYPTMRRGGRMLYAFDVSDATATGPTIKWKAGCPNLDSDTGCSPSDLSGIGQTWSTPNIAFLSKHSTTVPVVIMGAGYDSCEDADRVTIDSSTCSKGKGVYVLDGDTGTVLANLPTDRSVAADVVLTDVNGDGKPDFGYAVDTAGNIYRINFVNKSTYAALDPSEWTISKVAYTHDASRKFLFAPAVLPLNGQVYLALGSGDREHPTAASYPYTTPVGNRFYVYLDDPARTEVTNLDDPAKMLNQTNDNTCSTPGVLPGGDNRGWFMDLPGRGEQTVTSALIIGGMAAFSTNRPFGSATVCSNDLGEARGYLVNLINGSGGLGVNGASCGGERSSTFIGGGLPPSPVRGVVSVDGIPTDVVIGVIDDKPCGPECARPPPGKIDRTRRRVYWGVSTDTR